LPVLHYEFAVNDDGADIGATGSVYQQVWMVKGLQVRLQKVQQNYISFFPLGQAADIVSES
jgi:hypothetical protein